MFRFWLFSLVFNFLEMTTEAVHEINADDKSCYLLKAEHANPPYVGQEFTDELQAREYYMA